MTETMLKLEITRHEGGIMSAALYLFARIAVAHKDAPLAKKMHEQIEARLKAWREKEEKDAVHKTEGA